jgi:hypothetical protein
MHVDLGPERQWGERFPVRATAFSEETPPAREVLADSRTMKGGGAAGVATLGAAGVEVAQGVLAETQTAILPLVAIPSRLQSSAMLSSPLRCSVSLSHLHSLKVQMSQNRRSAKRNPPLLNHTSLSHER